MSGLEILIHVKPQKRQEFLCALEAFTSEECRLEGCVSVGVFEEHGIPNHFLWMERWQRQAILEERLRSGSFHALLGAIKVLGELQSLNIVEFEDRRVL